MRFDGIQIGESYWIQKKSDMDIVMATAVRNKSGKVVFAVSGFPNFTFKNITVLMHVPKPTTAHKRCFYLSW